MMNGIVCPECGKGTMHSTEIQNYRTTFDHVPFVVPEAQVCVCDHCGETTFNGKDLKAWRLLFYKSTFLKPAEIRDIREALGMTEMQLAALIGVRTMDICWWEKEDYDGAGIRDRSADLLLRMVRENLINEELGIIATLKELYEIDSHDMQTIEGLREYGEVKDWETERD